MRKFTTLNYLRYEFSLRVEDKVHGCRLRDILGIRVRERYSAPVLFRFPEIFALIIIFYLFKKALFLPKSGGKHATKHLIYVHQNLNSNMICKSSQFSYKLQ